MNIVQIICDDDSRSLVGAPDAAIIQSYKLPALHRAVAMGRVKVLTMMLNAYSRTPSANDCINSSSSETTSHTLRCSLGTQKLSNCWFITVQIAEQILWWIRTLQALSMDLRLNVRFSAADRIDCLRK